MLPLFFLGSNQTTSNLMKFVSRLQNHHSVSQNLNFEGHRILDSVLNRDRKFTYQIYDEFKRPQNVFTLLFPSCGWRKDEINQKAYSRCKNLRDNKKNSNYRLQIKMLKEFLLYKIDEKSKNSKINENENQLLDLLFILEYLNFDELLSIFL